jgi:MOB kinase activator 1
MFRFLLNCTIETVEPTAVKENIDDESKQKHLIRCTRTLVGIRTFREAVILPYDEELNEWLFSNAINFFKEVSVIWGFVCITEIPTCEISDGFPKGYEYKFSDGETIKTPIRCSGPGYVDRVLNWVEGQINKFCSRGTSADA